jgi:hypothetical protein
MRDIADRVLSRCRKRWVRSKRLFEHLKPVSVTDLVRIEEKVNVALPEDLKAWLLAVGYGDIDEDLSFRSEWFKQVEQGELKGAVLFAQDSLGNFYAYMPKDGRIIFFSREAPEYAILALGFRAFMEELEHRDFKVLEWVDSVSALPYDWDA